MLEDIKSFTREVACRIKEVSFIEAIGIMLLTSLCFTLLIALLCLLLIAPWFSCPVIGFLIDIVFIAPIVLVVYIKYFMKDILSKDY